MAKIYLNDVIYAQLAALSILTIIELNIEDETLHEFVLKFVKIALAMFYASEKKKPSRDKIFPLYNNKHVKEGPGLSNMEIE